MLIGYARVSSTEQQTRLQLDALRAAGVRTVFEDHKSAVKRRPQLQAALTATGPGDVLVVYKIDRLARSLRDLLAILAKLEARGAMFRSLTEPIDTTTPAGRLTLQILGACAEFERALIRERSMAGQEAARTRGARIGRPRAMTPKAEAETVRLLAEGRVSMTELALRFGVHLSTIKRAWLRVHKPESPAVKQRNAGRIP